MLISKMLNFEKIVSRYLFIKHFKRGQWSHNNVARVVQMQRGQLIVCRISSKDANCLNLIERERENERREGAFDGATQKLN